MVVFFKSFGALGGDFEGVLRGVSQHVQNRRNRVSRKREHQHEGLGSFKMQQNVESKGDLAFTIFHGQCFGAGFSFSGTFGV